LPYNPDSRRRVSIPARPAPWHLEARMSDRRKRRGDKAARRERVRQIADVLRDAEPTPFAMQAACTHAIRAKLCLEGWPFDVAHEEADKLVKAALDLVGAKRPSWEMGQPDYAHPDLRTRTRCAWCARPLPEGHRLWCSTTCGDAARHAHYRRDKDTEAETARRVAQIAWKGPAPKRRLAA
jgi:hypothetical protein